MTNRLLPLLAGLALLAGCATVPPAALPGRDRMGDFALDARFALRVTLPDQPPSSSGGRLSWEHRDGGDRVLIANPLGVGLAEIEITPAIARLQTADGKRHESKDADILMAEVTGQALPVSRLSAWLLGRAGRATRVEKDASGRPSRFTEADWQIDYGYEGDAPEALPARLTLSRANEIELRLRIEEWKDAP